MASEQPPLLLLGAAPEKYDQQWFSEVLAGLMARSEPIDTGYIPGTLNHDGDLVGFYGTEPVAQAANIGQLTDSTGGATDGELVPVSTFSDKFWAFSSPTGTTGSFYWGGFYMYAASSNDFSAGPTFGTANISYAAHFYVVLGAATVDELTLTVTGTSITDAGVRTTSDTENIVIPNAAAVDSYYETAKKWLGTVTITVASGTAKVCDHGYAKYWDNANTDFTVKGCEATWLAGANDTSPDIQLIHHKTTGWTYTGSGATVPTPIASMATDHSTESQVRNNECGAWKRTNLDTAIEGSGSEGVLFCVVTTTNRAFEAGTLQLHLATVATSNDNFAELAEKVNALEAAIGADSGVGLSASS